MRCFTAVQIPPSAPMQKSRPSPSIEMGNSGPGILVVQRQPPTRPRLPGPEPEGRPPAVLAERYAMPF